MSNLALHEIARVARTSVAERLVGDLGPLDRVTLTREALASDEAPGEPPRSDVRWYRPRGVAVLAFRGGPSAPTDPLGGMAQPRGHRGVRAYLRTMALAG